MSELRAGERVAGYVIERELGRGGMGAVFLARDERIGRSVALKVIVASLAVDPGFRARFEREGRIAATLEHPHVVPVYDVGESDGVLFIAMRFVDGRDLASILQAGGPVAPRRVGRLVSHVAAALDVAHRAGLVHRDVKPANVLVAGTAGDEHAYLTDFGLTRDATSETGLTGTGQWVGTLDYAAPEQIEGGIVDARTDVYALGCMTFHALTGQVPFTGGPPAKLYAHLAREAPRASVIVADLPDGVDDVIATAMAKRQDDRFPSAGDFARELASAVTGIPNLEPQRSVATGRALSGIPAAPEAAKPPLAAAAEVPPTVRGDVRPAKDVLVSPTTPRERDPAPSRPSPPRTPRPARVRGAAPAAAEPPARRGRGRAVAAAVAGVLLLGGGLAVGVALSGGGAREGGDGQTDALRGSATDTQGRTTEGDDAGTTRTATTEQDLTSGAGNGSSSSASSSGGGATAFAPYTSESGYVSTDVPAGSGWTLVGERELNPGLLRTELRGPEGARLWIDVTPAEPPGFDPESVSVRSDRRLADGIREIVFSGGRQDFCATSTCALYQLDFGDSGIAVIAGPTSAARAAARRTATSASSPLR